MLKHGQRSIDDDDKKLGDDGRASSEGGGQDGGGEFGAARQIPCIWRFLRHCTSFTRCSA